MATGWGPLTHPTDDHSSGKTVGSPTGDVRQPDENSVEAAPKHPTNYDATDGRHSKPNHEGWETVDTMGGTNVGDDGCAHGKFVDGPGPWRQT